MESIWIIKNIFNKIYFHPLFIFICFISVITSSFKNIIYFTILILIHELGHFITGLLLGWKVDKIYIYPYGGCTKFNNFINTKIKEELLVLIMGPLVQIVFFLIIKNYIDYYDYLIFYKYNYSILFINLLPIYPLDGGKLFNLIISLKTPYKKSLIISTYISLVFIPIFFIFNNSLSLDLVIFLILFKVFEEYKKINYIYNKFLLERYIYNLKFKKIKIIKNIDELYRDKKHVISNKTEKKYLKEYFLKCKKM